MEYGIKGQKAEEFKIAKWVDDQGKVLSLNLSFHRQIEKPFLHLVNVLQLCSYRFAN